MKGSDEDNIQISLPIVKYPLPQRSNPTSSPLLLRLMKCRAIDQAVSRRLPTAAARVQTPVRLCGIRSGQSGSEASFLPVLRFLLPVLSPPTAPHSLSSGAGTIGQLVADVPSGVSLTPPQESKNRAIAWHSITI
jgi:hypothetical protein